MLVDNYTEIVPVRATPAAPGSPLGSTVVTASGQLLPLSRENRQYMGRNLSGKAFFELGYRRNSLVAGGVNLRGIAMQLAYLEAVDGNEAIPIHEAEPIKDSAALQLLMNPNPYQSWSELILQLEANLCLGGSAYLYKKRDGAGVSEEIYCYNSSQMTPVSGTYEWIKTYRYDNGNGEVRVLLPSDVGRFVWGMHDWDRPASVTGPMSPLATLLDTDSNAADVSLSLLTRGATPASLITLPPKLNALGEPNGYYSQAELVEYKQFYETSYSGANRGSNMIGPPGTDVKLLGFNPKQMMVREFSSIPETRFCFVFGIPVQMTPLWSSAMAKTYNNYGEARLSFYQDTMIPHGVVIADMLTRMFRGEIFRQDRRPVRFRFNWSRAIAMQQFIGEKMQTMYEENSAKLNDTLKANGLPEDAEYGDKYLFELLAGQKEKTDTTTSANGLTGEES